MSNQTNASTVPSTPTKSAKPVRPRVPLLRILIALAVIVAALNACILGAKALIKPGNGAPGTLLYATQFQDPKDADWYQYQSAASLQITNNTLLLSMDVASEGVFSPLNYPLADFDVHVVGHQLSGDDPYSEYGVLFRYQDPKNYYMFKFRADGAYHVERTLIGVTADLSAPHVAPVAAPGSNHYNDLRVVGSGSQFQFYLNGQLLTLCPKGNDKFSTWNGDKCLSNGGQTSQTLTDTTFPDGKIGLGLYENQQAVSVAFSNFVVFSPQLNPTP